MITIYTKLPHLPPCFSVTYKCMEKHQIKLLKLSVSQVFLTDWVQLSLSLPRETLQYKASYKTVETRPTFCATIPNYMDEMSN